MCIIPFAFSREGHHSSLDARHLALFSLPPTFDYLQSLVFKDESALSARAG